MPRDISSSSSEDEAAEDSGTETVKEPRQKATRYRCPADFVTFQHIPCSSTLADSLKSSKKELWLIKAPASFNSECFSGMKVPLSGLQTVKIPHAAAAGSSQQVYSLLASTQSSSELHLLTSTKQVADHMVFAPTFSGLLNVHECYVDISANRTPKAIPAAPAPSIPSGLKQRFHPFGSKIPTLTCVAEDELDGASLGPSSVTLLPLVVKQFEHEVRNEEVEIEEEGRKKKKKKKKEKRMKIQEVEEVVQVKQEPADEVQEDVKMELPFLEGGQSMEKRKKKKKKRDREEEELEERLEPSVEVKVEDVSVKSEPMNTWCDDPAEVPAKKKKKKKKKSKTADD